MKYGRIAIVMITTFSLMSCGLCALFASAYPDWGVLEGTWSLAYDGGTGSFSLKAFETQHETEGDPCSCRFLVYSGTGQLGDAVFDALTGRYGCDDICSIKFQTWEDDFDADWILFAGELDGDTISGTYSSHGAHASHGSGDFVAQRNSDPSIVMTEIGLRVNGNSTPLLGGPRVRQR